MKNLKNYLISVMIGMGSLGIFGNKGYGQRALEEDEIPSLTVIAGSLNHQEFQIEYWREFGDGEIVLNKYFDTNHDGEIDSSSVFSYSPGDNKVSKIETSDPLSLIETLYPIWAKKNLPLGETFIDCEEGYFKKNIQDYIK